MCAAAPPPAVCILSLRCQVVQWFWVRAFWGGCEKVKAWGVGLRLSVGALHSFLPACSHLPSTPPSLPACLPFAHCPACLPCAHILPACLVRTACPPALCTQGRGLALLPQQQALPDRWIVDFAEAAVLQANHGAAEPKAWGGGAEGTDGATAEEAPVRVFVLVRVGGRGRVRWGRKGGS